MQTAATCFLVRRDDDDEDEDSGTLLLNGCKLSGVWGVENCGGTFEAVNVTAVMREHFCTEMTDTRQKSQIPTSHPRKRRSSSVAIL